MQLINDIQLPIPILEAMMETIKAYSKGKAQYTPSSLTIGSRRLWGELNHADGKIYASRAFAAFTGTLMHIALELLLKDYKKYKTEFHIDLMFNEYSNTKLDTDVCIGGTIDLLQIKGVHVLYDYKTMSTQQEITDRRKHEWTIKANIYRWLITKSGGRVDYIYYLPIFKDWTPTKSIRSKYISEIPAPMIQLDIWSDERIEQWLHAKITKHELYKDKHINEIPYCNAEEREADPNYFKIYKVTKGVVSNTAIKNSTFYSKEAAFPLLGEKLLGAKTGTSYIIKELEGYPHACYSLCNLWKAGICKYSHKEKH